MQGHPRLVIRELRVRAASVPMTRPLQTCNGAIRHVPLALIDLHTEEGVTGSTYLFCYTPPALRPVVELLKQLRGAAPPRSQAFKPASSAKPLLPSL